MKIKEFIVRFETDGENLHDQTNMGELIRCDHCKYFHTLNGDIWCDVFGVISSLTPTGYCDKAERKQ